MAINSLTTIVEARIRIYCLREGSLEGIHPFSILVAEL